MKKLIMWPEGGCVDDSFPAVTITYEELTMATLDTPLTERRHIPDRRANTHTSALGAVDWVAMVLLIIGGINWGLMGLMGIDLVASVFGDMTDATRVTYIIVGLSALYAIYLCARLASGRRT
jgi:hypothetical protein